MSNPGTVLSLWVATPVPVGIPWVSAIGKAGPHAGTVCLPSHLVSPAVRMPLCSGAVA